MSGLLMVLGFGPPSASRWEVPLTSTLHAIRMAFVLYDCHRVSLLACLTIISSFLFCTNSGCFQSKIMMI